MTEPWTRQEQINYSTFGTKEAPPEWAAVWKALQQFAHNTNYEYSPGMDVLKHFLKFHERHTAAEMSVD